MTRGGTKRGSCGNVETHLFRWFIFFTYMMYMQCQAMNAAARQGRPFVQNRLRAAATGSHPSTFLYLQQGGQPPPHVPPSLSGGTRTSPPHAPLPNTPLGLGIEGIGAVRGIGQVRGVEDLFRRLGNDGDSVDENSEEEEEEEDSEEEEEEEGSEEGDASNPTLDTMYPLGKDVLFIMRGASGTSKSSRSLPPCGSNNVATFLDEIRREEESHRQRVAAYLSNSGGASNIHEVTLSEGDVSWSIQIPCPYSTSRSEVNLIGQHSDSISSNDDHDGEPVSWTHIRNSGSVGYLSCIHQNELLVDFSNCRYTITRQPEDIGDDDKICTLGIPTQKHCSGSSHMYSMTVQNGGQQNTFLLSQGQDHHGTMEPDRRQTIYCESCGRLRVDIPSDCTFSTRPSHGSGQGIGVGGGSGQLRLGGGIGGSGLGFGGGGGFLGGVRLPNGLDVLGGIGGHGVFGGREGLGSVTPGNEPEGQRELPECQRGGTVYTSERPRVGCDSPCPPTAPCQDQTSCLCYTLGGGVPDSVLGRGTVARSNGEEPGLEGEQGIGVGGGSGQSRLVRGIGGSRLGFVPGGLMRGRGIIGHVFGGLGSVTPGNEPEGQRELPECQKRGTVYTSERPRVGCDSLCPPTAPCQDQTCLCYTLDGRLPSGVVGGRGSSHDSTEGSTHGGLDGDSGGGAIVQDGTHLHRGLGGTHDDGNDNTRVPEGAIVPYVPPVLSGVGGQMGDNIGVLGGIGGHGRLPPFDGSDASPPLSQLPHRRHRDQDELVLTPLGVNEVVGYRGESPIIHVPNGDGGDGGAGMGNREPERERDGSRVLCKMEGTAYTSQSEGARKDCDSPCPPTVPCQHYETCLCYTLDGGIPSVPLGGPVGRPSGVLGGPGGILSSILEYESCRTRQSGSAGGNVCRAWDIYKALHAFQSSLKDIFLQFDMDSTMSQGSSLVLEKRKTFFLREDCADVVEGEVVRVDDAKDTPVLTANQYKVSCGTGGSVTITDPVPTTTTDDGKVTVMSKINGLVRVANGGTQLYYCVDGINEASGPRCLGS